MKAGVRLERLVGRTPEAEAAVARLVAACGDYYRLVNGREPGASDIDDVFSFDVPGIPGEDIHGYLVYDGEDAVGFAGMILGWKRPGQSMIGMLAVHPARRGKGTGRAAAQSLEAVARASPHGRSLRIGVVESNARALDFWHALGYRETGERPVRPEFTAPIVILEKALDAA